MTGSYNGILVTKANASWNVVGPVSSMARKVALAEAETTSSAESRIVRVHETRSASNAVLSNLTTGGP